MKNPSVAILTAASDLLAEGAKIKDVLARQWDTPEGPDRLTYSQLWLFHTRRFLPEGQDLAHLTPASKEGQAAITAARAADQSWGYIAVRFNKPEAQVRKQYTEATGVKSAGLRIGRGGRWLDGDAVLYQDERKVIGIAIPQGTPRAAYRDLIESHADYLEKLPTAELKRRCRVLGIKATKSRDAMIKALDERTSPVPA